MVLTTVHEKHPELSVMIIGLAILISASVLPEIGKHITTAATQVIHELNTETTGRTSPVLCATSDE